MASAINDNYPIEGNPTTQSVRDNFTAAKNEITNLQSQMSSILLGGTTPGGPAGGALAGQYPNPTLAEPLSLIEPLQVGGTYVGPEGFVEMTSGDPGFGLVRDTNPVNERVWAVGMDESPGNFGIYAMADNYSGVLQAWKLHRDGSTEMPGPVLLAAAPTADNHATTKAYVDSLIATVGALEARIARLEKIAR